ncbi:hypothetical protein D3C72_753950 [compost metagenome]
MILDLEILNGIRKGNKINIPLLEGNPFFQDYLLEDEAIKFTLFLTEYSDKVSIVLHENEVESTYSTEHEDGWLYVWLPRQLGRGYFESFFHNYYGIAELSISIHRNDFHHSFNLAKIDVLAKKINADKVNGMLEFLAKHNSEALCSFFRVTRRNAGFKEGDTPIDIFVEQLENITKSIAPLIKGIASNPITKLSHADRYVQHNERTNIDDLTLSWISDNVDQLIETDDIDLAILEYSGSYYSVNKIKENALIEVHDVYENQIVHGFIYSLIMSASSILNGFTLSKPQPSKINSSIEGYSSLFTQIKKFQKEINAKNISRCRDIIETLSAMKFEITRRIPTKKIETGIPTFTMKAKNKPHYLSLYNKIVMWHRYGKPDWSMQEELLSIKNIPKLFEYYLLFYIKENLDRIFTPAVLSLSNKDAIQFSYSLGEYKITLYYEPIYWMIGHTNVDSSSLINIENWTVKNNDVTRRGSTHKYSQRSPDYVIALTKNDTILKCFILDAKYTKTKKAFIEYIPDLVLKYLHGLHSPSFSKNVISGLMIVNPSDSAQTMHFHNSTYDIFSETPISPAIILSSISPGNEFTDNVDFEKILKRITDLYIVESNGKIEGIQKNRLSA